MVCLIRGLKAMRRTQPAPGHRRGGDPASHAQGSLAAQQQEVNRQSDATADANAQNHRQTACRPLVFSGDVELGKRHAVGASKGGSQRRHARFPRVMLNLGLRDDHDRQTRASDPDAQVVIFAVEKVPGVKEADGFNRQQSG